MVLGGGIKIVGVCFLPWTIDNTMGGTLGGRGIKIVGVCLEPGTRDNDCLLSWMKFNVRNFTSWLKQWDGLLTFP